MSKKKHNISYIKPEEPKFLRELKAAAGYKEGPDVDTKRGKLPNDNDDDDDDDDDDNDDNNSRKDVDEQPTVVVLGEGDLTAKEAEEFKRKKVEEEANAPADLSKRIIFESKRKSEAQNENGEANVNVKSKKSRKSKPTKSVLSFNEEEEDE